MTQITGSAADTTGFGLTVWVDVGGGHTILYAHLGSTSVTVGQTISSGTVIGELGQSGNADGQPLPEAHVHVQIMRNGIAIDPHTFLNSPCPTGVGSSR